MFTPEEIDAILERIRNNTASAEDWDALRQALSQPVDMLQIPLRQKQINFIIGELKGRDIQIGDRFTTEQILGQKIIYVSVDEIKTREFNQTSPYKGLKKFEPGDKECFFGRDQFITELANELERTNLLLLLGASGSGKSSVVRAGLLAWLQKERGSRLVNLTFTPDQDPFESLYGSLLRYYKQAEAQVAREGREDTLTQVVTGLRRSDSFWFIFIDQFEELFTTSQGEKRDRFIAGLVQLNTALKLLGSTKDCPVKIVATMRADFLDRFSPYPTLVKATDKHRPLMAEMRVDELRQAIEQPAAHHGVVFETGLVEEITKDVQGQAGYLPLLQYTLNLLWETEEKHGSIRDRTLNISTYRGLGGVRGALQKRVNQIYEALPEAERLAAQRIFLKLVEIGGDEESGTEWKPVRRRALRSEFDSELEQRVLVQLIDENLLVSDILSEALRDRQSQAQASTVEIAHEALLTSWETLNTWIKENRQAIGLRNRLNDDVARWQAKKAEDELWTGSKLEQVLELKKNPTFKQVMGGFSSTANQFIDASLGLRDRVRKRQIRQARTIAAVSISAAALVSVAGVVAMLQRQEAIQQRQETVKQKEQAERQAQVALAQQVIAKAEVARRQNSSQLQLSMLLAIEGTRRLNKFGIHSTEGDAILRHGLSLLPPHISSNSVENYDTLTNELKARLSDARACQIKLANSNSICTSPDRKNRFQVTHAMGLSPGISSPDFTVNILDTKDNQVLAVLPFSSQFFSFAFSQDSRYVMIADESGASAFIWDLNSGQSSARLSARLIDANSGKLTFSNDGRHLYISRDDNVLPNKNSFEKRLEVKDFNLETGEIDKKSPLTSENAKLSFYGKYAITSNNNILQILDLSTNRVVLNLDMGPAIFSFDEQYIATLSGKDKILRVLEVATGKKIFEKSIAQLADQSVFGSTTAEIGKKYFCISEDLLGEVPLFRQNEKCLQYFLQDGFSVREDNLYFAHENSFVASLWNLAKNKIEIMPLTVLGRTTGIKLSPSGKYLATTNRASIIQIFDVSNAKEISRIQNEGSYGSLAFSPDEKHLAIVSNNNTVKVLAIPTGQEVYRLEDKFADQIEDMIFSPDGKSIATSSSQNSVGKIQLWSLQTQDLIPELCSRLTRNLRLDEWKQVFGELPYQRTCSNLPSEDLPANSSGAKEPATPPEVTPSPVASQSPSTPAETPSAPTVSPSPSPLTSSYKFEFPQASCGDPSARPGSAFPVFIDNKPLEAIRSKYCADAYPVSKREKTGKPSVQVASFIDRQKAEAFAQEVGGEVGEP